MAILRDDPYGAFNYKVTITPRPGEEIRAGFSDVTGLSTEVQYAEYREGTDSGNHSRRIPTTYKVGDITLKRGLIGSLDLFAWIDRVRKGDPSARATVLIQLFDEGGRTVIAAWKLLNARPSKWTGPTLGAKSTEVAMEELTLVCEDLEFEYE